MRLLVVNAGSSSLKLSMLDAGGAAVAGTTVENWQGPDHLGPLQEFLADRSPVDAVGHRVVHGGPRHTGPERIDEALIDSLDALSSLAPLHMSRALAGIRAIERLLPGVPQVACFDTTFHAAMPPAAATYAVPRAWNERWGLRRYGFHGLSHAYAVRRAAEIVGRPVAELRIVSAHLGAGASLAAVRDGASVDTTMGFTPLAGLVMNTRSGSVDPGLLLWLLEHGQQPLAAVADALEHQSGLKGLSGTTGDLREVLAGADAGDAACALAWDVYVHRLARETAAMTAATGGLDVLVFTGGVGEHSWQLRSALADALAHLGLAVDADLNRTTTADAEITAPGAPARTVVVTAREDLEVRRQVLAVLPSISHAGAAGPRTGQTEKVGRHAAAVVVHEGQEGGAVEQQDWAQVVAAATRAPSIHNTQPWRFAASADELDVFLDRERALPVLDPTGRQQIISCGIAVEFAVVALAARGRSAEVVLVPDAGAPDHLATIRLTGNAGPSDQDTALADAIAERHTVRAAFLPRQVPADLVDRMQADAGRFGAWFKPITRSEEEVAMAFLVSRAEEIEQGDPAYLAELQSWMRTDPASVDGVPVEAVVADDPRGRPSNWLIRDFVAGSREQSAFLPAGDPDAPPPDVERPTVVLMGTNEDDRDDWLQAGRALARVLLRATVEGVAASPLTQALDWPATRIRMQSQLSLVGHPQMLLRMGYPPDTQTASSGRRPVEEVLTFR